jgi:hypothetical protein
MAGYTYTDNGPFYGGPSDASGRLAVNNQNQVDNSGWQVTTGRARNSGALSVGAKSQGQTLAASDGASSADHGLMHYALIAGAALAAVLIFKRVAK